jgi:hypothetical protein
MCLHCISCSSKTRGALACHHLPVAGVIPFEFAAYTRWSWALQPAWHSAGKARKVLHALARPLVAAAWKLFEVLFPLHTGTPSKGLGLGLRVRV